MLVQHSRRVQCGVCCCVRCLARAHASVTRSLTHSRSLACSPRHSGDCKLGYYRLSDRCHKCPENAYWTLLLLIVAALGFGAFILWLGQPSRIKVVAPNVRACVMCEFPQP